MKTRQRHLAAATTLLAAALSLTACASHPAPNDKIPSADRHKSSPPKSPSPQASDDSGRPKMTFPKDLKILFEDWKTSKGTKAQDALDDTAEYVRSILFGVVKQDSDSKAVNAYSAPLSPAQRYAQHFIKVNVKDHLTATGKVRYYHPSVRLSDDGKRSVVNFCEDQSDVYSKETKTGKVLHTKESSDSYLNYEVVMEPVPEKNDWWWAQSIVVDDGGQKCS